MASFASRNSVASRKACVVGGKKWHVFCGKLAGFSHTCSMNCRIFFLRVSHLDILRVLIYP